MNIKAEPEKRFLLKYLLIGVLCFGFFLYAVYDGFYKYPSKLPRAEAWQELVDDTTLDDAARVAKWKQVAQEKGWAEKRPTKDESVESIEHLILFNYGCMVVGLAIAIPCIVWYFRNRNTWIALTDDGLSNSQGAHVPLKQITKIDKKKWMKKGIAIIHYSNGQGTDTFVIDDLKYQRHPTDQIMAQVESQVDRSIIVNGPAEAELAESNSPQPQQEDGERHHELASNSRQD